jgi:hypothetical protein
LDKFYNKKGSALDAADLVCSLPGKIPHEEKLCGSFWWRDVLKQVDNFREVAVGRGDTALFWNDKWSIDGSTQSMSTRFPKKKSLCT